ncbi:permease prefix domain 1-containing protein [Nonomuraea sp. CA-143628]|uniref:permease prefix domain 1-containing protein n=1 Tax=Nonomuraea sp. CA-143628 TaxID=3239997 RepID=UPI003D8F9819
MRIDDYVAELGRSLAGPPGPKRDLVVEARDSLADTADALEAEGLARAEAERLAVQQFGAIPEIASGYQRELTAAAGRRLGLLLFISVPMTVMMWSAIWRFYPTDTSVAAWVAMPAWFHAASRVLDILQLSTGLYGGLSLFMLSRGSRWIRRPRLVTKSLGIVVWLMLPATGGLSMLLSYGAGPSPSAQTILPIVLANLMTAAFWGLQLYGATRCLRVSQAA